MPVDHLIKFGDLIPDRLEIELMRNGNVAPIEKGVTKMHLNWNLSLDSAKKAITRSWESDPRQQIAMLLSLLRNTAQLATFKAGEVRKTTHQHLFLPKIYSGNPIASAFPP
jgi:hypothetical protein